MSKYLVEQYWFRTDVVEIEASSEFEAEMRSFFTKDAVLVSKGKETCHSFKVRLKPGEKDPEDETQ